MFTAYRSFATLLIVLFSLSTALAQTQQSGSQPPTPVVTAAASTDRVRYASLGEVHQTRLQVFSGDGAQVFDSSFRLGNLITWRLTDQQGSRLTNGSCLFLVTVKDFSGGLTQKYGTTLIEQGRVYLEQTGRDELPQPQAATLEANRLAEAFTPVDRAGAAGLNRADITASPDGTPSAGAQPSGTVKSSQPGGGGENIAGTGTQNKIAKWLDNTGTLGDSNIFENASGKIGIGTVSPNSRLDIKQAADNFIGGLHLRRSTTNDTWALVTGDDNNFYIGYAKNASGADAMTDFTVYPLILTANNRVGIGTSAPAAKLHVNGNVNFTGLRTEATASTPNVVGGFSGNTVTAGVVGAVIGGGGSGAGSGNTNSVTDDFGTVGGGQGNRAGGGVPGTTDKPYATVGGGSSNAASSDYSTIGGGGNNTASNVYSTISGGDNNNAGGYRSTIGGGAFNTASGAESTIPGGVANTAQGNFSFAAGQRAKALHLGSFVWSDSTTASPNFFSSTADNQFLINATGGVGIGTNSPGAARLKVQGGDVYIASPNSLVITSPNGSCWKITVSDAGALTAASVTCP